MNHKKQSNLYIYLSIITLFIVFFLGILVHDPLLHSVIVILNHWEFASYSTSLGAGSTDALVSPTQIAATPTFNYWLFFMFPPIFIFIFSFLIILFYPDRLFIIAGHILIALNFSSLIPSLPGSDAYNAVQFLISRGWAEPIAYAVHYIILIIMFILWGLYMYIGTENSPKDAGSRTRNIYQ